MVSCLLTPLKLNHNDDFKNKLYTYNINRITKTEIPKEIKALVQVELISQFLLDPYHNKISEELFRDIQS